LDRIQEELRWITLTPKQKLRDLLAMTHFTPAQFRRCLDLIKELIRQGNPEDAVALGTQYLSIFDDYLLLEIQEVSRLPELLRSLAATQAEFWDAAAACLTQAIGSRKLNQLVHVQVVNALVTLAKIAATYENFALVQKVGEALEESAAHDSASHTLCCKPALSNLLQPSAVDRITEMFLIRRMTPLGRAPLPAYCAGPMRERLNAFLWLWTMSLRRPTVWPSCDCLAGLVTPVCRQHDSACSTKTGLWFAMPANF